MLPLLNAKGSHLAFDDMAFEEANSQRALGRLRGTGGVAFGLGEEGFYRFFLKGFIGFFRVLHGFRGFCRVWGKIWGKSGILMDISLRRSLVLPAF